MVCSFFQDFFTLNIGYKNGLKAGYSRRISDPYWDRPKVDHITEKRASVYSVAMVDVTQEME